MIKHWQSQVGGGKDLFPFTLPTDIPLWRREPGVGSWHIDHRGKLLTDPLTLTCSSPLIESGPAAQAWHCLQPPSPNQQWGNFLTGTQVNLMEAIPQLRVHFPRSVKLTNNINYHTNLLKHMEWSKSKTMREASSKKEKSILKKKNGHK